MFKSKYNEDLDDLDDLDEDTLDKLKRYVRKTMVGLSIFLLLSYAVNVSQTYPRVRTAPWIKEALDMAPEAFLAPASYQDSFIERFFKSHKAIMNTVYRAPLKAALTPFMPGKIPSLGLDLRLLTNPKELLQEALKSVNPFGGGGANQAKPNQAKPNSIMNARRKLAGVTVNYAVTPYILYKLTYDTGLEKHMPKWFIRATRALFIANLAQGFYV
jgi:hypothetical protein